MVALKISPKRHRVRSDGPGRLEREAACFLRSLVHFAITLLTAASGIERLLDILL